MGQPAMGIISYGDTTFGVTSRSSIRSTPRWDDARRTIVAVRHELHVRGYVTAGGAADTDTEMATLHTQLETPGLRLRYDSGMGWGELDVNAPGGQTKDVSWGPHPILVSFSPLGGGAAGNQAALVEWTCSTELPSCIGGAAYEKQLMAFNYDWHHTVDGNGLSTTSINGYIEIPLTRRSGSRSIPDWADNYRHLLEQIPDPVGFRREGFTYHMTGDRKRLNFSWQWKELPFPLPLGVSYADVDHHVSWSMGSKAALLQNQLSGSITMAPGQGVAKAVEKWQAIVASRIAAAQDEKKLVLAGKVAPIGGKPPMVVIDHANVREKVFGEGAAARTVHFQTNYTVIGTTLPHLMAVSGLFRWVPGTDFDKWKTSLKDSAFASRGYANVKWDNVDAIVDLCIKSPQTNVSILRNRQQNELKVIDKKDINPPGQVAQLQVFGANFNRDQVPKESSWIFYEAGVVMDEDNSIAMHKPLAGSSTITETDRATQEVASSPNQPSNPSQLGTFARADGLHPHETTTTENVFQRVGSPTVRIWLVGKALRLGHRIPTPKLDKVGDQETRQMSQVVREWVVTAVAGIPIYGKTWRIEYEFKKPPSKIPALGNPALQLPASTAAEMLGD